MSRQELTVYAQCGLRIRSEVELHLPVSVGDAWDIDVRWGPDFEGSSSTPGGEVIASYESGDRIWYTATESDSGYCLRFNDCGDFLISKDLSEVQVRPDPSGRPILLPILLAGTVTAFVLSLRGETVLHASAVAIEDSVLAFIGQSGRGKSTLAALMCTHGAQLVADDLLTITAGSRVTCIGGSSEIRLRQAATAIVSDRLDAATRVTADERLAFAAHTAQPVSMPLRAIVIPTPSHSASEIEVKRVDATLALLALMSFPRVHGWRRHDVLARDFDTLGRVTSLIPIFEVVIPWGPPFGTSVIDALTEIVSG